MPVYTLDHKKSPLAALPARGLDPHNREVPDAAPGVHHPVFVLESHPVQYRVPVYQELARLKPGAFEVIYASNCSVRGHRDAGFGVNVKWDVPLLEGYPNRVLNNEHGEPLRGFGSLHSRGLFPLIAKKRPAAVLFMQFAYAYDLGAYLSCLALRVPIWIRHETQDEAFARSPFKSLLRNVAYRVAYRPVQHAFFIGELNRRHLLNCGVPGDRMSRAPYCVPNPLGELPDAQKQTVRTQVRTRYGIAPDECVVCFSGKLIPKKHPDLLLQAGERLKEEGMRSFCFLFLGSGELEMELRRHAAALPFPVKFAGFVNQAELPAYYLAADVLVLPSRRMGETWGLVANEALHAGCAVAMSEAVGCAAEFGHFKRCRVFPAEDAEACARAIMELSRFPRDFNWAARRLEKYSVATAARAIAAKLP
ncbi:MAG: glycosyltransferase family 4 protein [Verrucomicrobiales bacterium]|nr:glycosyltransferase family 4 protein [Verrucomicrobiales bacterium]